MSNLNYKHFTYKWQNQPYVITKNNKNQIITSNARPITNGSWIINQPGGTEAKDGNAFLARPLKQWRKQLQPDLIRSGTQSKNIITSDLPGSVITLGSGLPKNTTPTCCNSSETICETKTICNDVLTNIWVATFSARISDDQNSVIYSNDNGKTWFPAGNADTLLEPFLGGLPANCVAYNGTHWLVGSISNNNNAIINSYNYLQWFVSNTVFNSNSIVNKIAWSSDINIWVSASVSASSDKPLYSYDGLNWTISNLISNSLTFPNNVKWGGPIANKKFLMVGENTLGPNKIIESNDGISWTYNSFNINNEILTSVEWASNQGANGRWVVSPTNNYGYYSDDNGTTWTQFSFIFTVYDIVWNGSLWVIVGDGGIAYSTNIIDMSTQTLSSNISFDYGTRVNWNGNMWVAIGNEDSPPVKLNQIPIMWSIDGINWFSSNIDNVNLLNDAKDVVGTFEIIRVCETTTTCKNYQPINTSIVSDIPKEKYNNFCDSTGNCSVSISQDDVINKCWNGPIGKRICCNPESNVIKQSQATPINDNFTNTSAYLQSRCKTYYQRLSSQHATGVKYYTSEPTYYSDLSGVALYPNDLPTGPQVTQKTSCSGNCGDNCENCNKSCPTGYVTQINQDTIYKPSNRPFSIEGAASGASRILKLKNDSFYQNGAQTNNANGLKATNYGYYNWEGNGSYFIKIKPTAPQCFSGPYNHTRCFFTPTGNISGPRGRLRGYR
jgi:hypothetical protein